MKETSSAARIFYAAYQSRLIRPGPTNTGSANIYHRVSDRSGEFARCGARAARGQGTFRQIRVHPQAGLDYFGDYTEAGQVIPVSFPGSVNPSLDPPPYAYGVHQIFHERTKRTIREADETETAARGAAAAARQF